MKESLAFMFEMANLQEDALPEYDELEQIYSETGCNCRIFVEMSVTSHDCVIKAPVRSPIAYMLPFVKLMAQTCDYASEKSEKGEVQGREGLNNSCFRQGLCSLWE